MSPGKIPCFAWKTPGNGDSTTSLGKLFQCLVTPTAKKSRNFNLEFVWLQFPVITSCYISVCKTEKLTLQSSTFSVCVYLGTVIQSPLFSDRFNRCLKPYTLGVIFQPLDIFFCPLIFFLVLIYPSWIMGTAVSDAVCRARSHPNSYFLFSYRGKSGIMYCSWHLLIHCMCQ